MECEGPSAAHLGTVRALHRAVVSLRTALESSKNELKQLKEKYEQHSNCIEYADVIEKLTLENHILRRKIIDSSTEDAKPQKVKLEVSYSPRTQNADAFTGSEVVIKTASEVNGNIETLDSDPIYKQEIDFCSADNINNVEKLESEEVNETANFSDKENSATEESESQIVSCKKEATKDNLPSFQTRLELLSKFDVRIKVRTLKEGTLISSTTSDSDSTVEDKKEKDTEKESVASDASFHFEERIEHFEDTERIKATRVNTVSESVKMAVPNEGDAKKTDKFDVQVRITSEENIVVKEHVERSRMKDTLNLDVDDLSLRSLSEGDNSVFGEGVVTPGDPRERETENASGNESEEVDDIELIFTTDESKDISNLQEDLVSICDTDHWAPTASAHSTPVLVKFHTLDPDRQPGESNNADHENQENSALQGLADSLRPKRVSLPNVKEMRHVAFSKASSELPGRGILNSCDNRSDNALYERSPSTRRLDSVDSLTCEYDRGLSFDNKSSSFEISSSTDLLHRDGSLDGFHKAARFGHRFSVFAERDISKCGTSEDDLSSHMYMRRNTCPNPFQYRPAARVPWRGGCGGPGGAAARARPVLRAPAAGARRERGAQTDVCALPPRSSSDHHLPPEPSAAPPPTRAPRRAAPLAPPDDARRALLSDIGFTSMVPELSRSADPVWTLGLRASAELDAAPAREPCKHAHTSCSRFLSRSPARFDRSFDRSPQNAYAYSKDFVPWRGSLPDVRHDTDELLSEAEAFVRRSIDNLRAVHTHDGAPSQSGQPYIPTEPRQLRLGHTVKVIAPHGRVLVGRVRYVGVAGGAAGCGVVVGAELARAGGAGGAPSNDGTLRGRRYFLAAPGHDALFVPFGKVVMAWAN